MAKIIILGGGFGGIAAARRLRGQLAPEDEILLFDRRDYFIVGFRKTWAMLGDPLDKGKGDLRSLNNLGIRFIQGNITRIDPQNRAVELDGKRYAGDALVIALGAALAPEAVPGFSEHALSVYDPGAISRAAGEIEKFPGGRILVGVFGGPYKCPPAPYEIAIMTKEKLAARAVDARIEVFSPLPATLPILGAAGCDMIESYLGDHGIPFHAEHLAEKVEPGQVLFKNGSRIDFDLLLGVAPHRVPKVVREAGLAGASGWIEVDARTLETSYPGVYAIGDVTAIPMANGKPLPKAGVFAEAEGLVVADRLAARLAGRETSAAFEGRGGCFLEVGNGKAVMVSGHFLAEGRPQVLLTEATEKFMQDKIDFEKIRLQEWFS